MTARRTPNGFELDDSGRRVVVDPITRIEGRLRVEVNLDADNAIRNAVSTGTMWRGLEVILKGRDPRDAWAFAHAEPAPSRNVGFGVVLDSSHLCRDSRGSPQPPVDAEHDRQWLAHVPGRRPMTAAPTAVLGVGNILWADEGFGVRCVEALERDFATDDRVTLVDGGTGGLALLEPLAAARRLVLFDSVAFGGVPGELKVVRDRDVPRFLDHKALSLHQTGLKEILALAELQGCLPDELVCISVEPTTLDDYGGGLSVAVARQIEPAVDVEVAQLRQWGHDVERRPRPLDEVTVNVAAIQREPYERGRPSAANACRIGDARFMPRGG